MVLGWGMARTHRILKTVHLFWFTILTTISTTRSHRPHHLPPRVHCKFTQNIINLSRPICMIFLWQFGTKLTTLWYLQGPTAVRHKKRKRRKGFLKSKSHFELTNPSPPCRDMCRVQPPLYQAPQSMATSLNYHIPFLFFTDYTVVIYFIKNPSLTRVWYKKS